jgi:hypothetical protein
MKAISDFERAAVERTISEMQARIFELADETTLCSTPVLRSAMREILNLRKRLLTDSIAESPLR